MCAFFSKFTIVFIAVVACTSVSDADPPSDESSPRYLTPGIYTADPSAHVFDDKLFIYPSHDVETDIAPSDDGDHFDMRDYHVFSLESPSADATDHGVALKVDDIPWASRQLWAPDCVRKDGKYYLYFPAKDKTDIFRMGVAIADRPEGPFKPQPDPIRGSYSIDPAVFLDDDGSYYMYFGGIWGGQLQRFRNNRAIECGTRPSDDEPALCPKVARLSEDMLQFAEQPRDVLIVDDAGTPITAGDHDRRFFEAAWLHKNEGKYYLSYSTGDTHLICYAISDNPYGPFAYQGVILTPVVGWTTHHSICRYRDQWYLFFHDSVPSGGQTSLRSMKLVPLQHATDGSIKTIDGTQLKPDP